MMKKELIPWGVLFRDAVSAQQAPWLQEAVRCYLLMPVPSGIETAEPQVFGGRYDELPTL